MLLEITTTANRATDLGFLLHKNPDNVYERTIGCGTVRVFYPEASDDRTTAVLWLDVDQVGLVRRGEGNMSPAQYVNDRAYVASSFLAVAIGQTFSSALAGRSKERPDRTTESWPLTVVLPALDCDAGPDFIRSLFEPLGYQVELTALPLDAQFPEWGPSTLYRLELAANIRVAVALTHIYILLPVLDNQKHYPIGESEVVKLLDNAGNWLAIHPMRDTITRRYLRYRRQYVAQALERLSEYAVQGEEGEEVETESQASEDTLEAPARLHDRRLDAVAEALSAGASGESKVADLGCGEGRLIQRLVRDGRWSRIIGMDVSSRALKLAARRLHLDRDERSDRIALVLGSLLYRDDRLCGFDAAALVEVIEHIEPDRLDFVERTLFGFARPGKVVVTTPNADYNSHWTSLPAGRFRHSDHRFEWSRAQFGTWAGRVASKFGYNITISGIGDVDGELGAPTQMAVFHRD